VKAVQSSPFITVRGDVIMAPNLLFYQRLLVALVLICLLTHVWGSDNARAIPQRPLTSAKPRRTRSKEPKPFTGFIHKPLCEAGG
jgi:hypothetical protein